MAEVRMWGIWCIRYDTSILGQAEHWMVTGGRWDDQQKLWDTSQERRWRGLEASARALAERMQSERYSLNVAYEAREVTNG